MAYPTPTIYRYRVLLTRDARDVTQAMYEAQFSINVGTTWFNLYPYSFSSLEEAKDCIANVVRAESQFRTKIQKKQATYSQVYAYP